MAHRLGDRRPGRCRSPAVTRSTLQTLRTRVSEWYKLTFCPGRGVRDKRDCAGGAVLPNLSVFWVILFVLVLTFVIERLLLRPVMSVIRAREQAIASARELAQRSASEAQAATAEFERKTAAARAEIYRQMDEMRRTALGRRAEIVAQTRAEAETAVAEALRQLDAESRAARRRLEADAETLGAAAADRILGRRAS
ncbi:MAG: hypothetical protein DMF86_08860 [Acidobacteria bacterium]|nr:MAG: hypothetical protein DMF86_08860 [Acidobacteriota bacterium]